MSALPWSLRRFAAALLVAMLAPVAATAQTAGRVQCSVATLQATAPPGTTVVKATIIAASESTPEHCQVDATVATPSNVVTFRVGLPASWNGKFYFEGVGGFAGTIGSLRAGLARGYASASTDTGHQGTGTDASWALDNPAREIDYGHRGTHVSAVAAKALSAAYYGTAPRLAYFNGCSNGGRQALMEAQRYPEDFDGIIAGDPSLGSLGHLKRTLIYQTMLSSADHVLPPEKVRVVSRAVLASCDAADGLEDGLVSDPRACAFRPETLACAGPDGPECLTRGQVETVKAIYADVPGPGGVTLPGFPAGHEEGSSGWPQWITGTEAPAAGPDGALTFAANAPLGYRFQDGFMRYLAFPKDDPSFDWRRFDLASHGPLVAATMNVFSPTDSDLGPFQKRGGKLIMYHGWADPALSALATVNYYEDVVERTGGQERSDEFVRLFMVPGMHHCQRNGPGPNTFDALTALEDWVERGVPPTRIVASHSTEGVVDRTRPLCPYPQVARHTGSGSIDAAENFRCEAPRK